MGFFKAIRKARRRKILASKPIPEELWDWAIKEHRILARLKPAERGLLREYATVFLGEKRFSPLQGAPLTEETRVSIAAQACLPLLGLPEGLEWYREFSTILLTPREYAVEKREYDEAGVIHEYDDEFAGEAFELGPVALSLPDVEASGWGEGYNVVIHEMAHKLDALDGAIDGCPPLHEDMDPERWRRVFSEAFSDLRSRLEAPAGRKSRRGTLRRRGGRGAGPSRIDPYAAESPDEFFAVLCEYFFERPELLGSEYPEAYGELVRFFRRDPADDSR